MLTGYPTPPTYHSKVWATTPKPPSVFSRLLAAAVINQGFCDLLLADPVQALAQGFQGEVFPLDFNEKNFLSSIRAESLSDFARQINTYLEKPTEVHIGQWIPVNQPAVVLNAG